MYPLSNVVEYIISKISIFTKPRIYKVHYKVPQYILDDILNTINNNELVVFPTDTLYALGANPFSDDSVLSVYRAKRRADKPIPILISNLKILNELVEVNDKALMLIDKYWPGPLTIILPAKSSRLSKFITLGINKLAIRMPGDDIALEIIEYCGGCLTGTSANITSQKPPCDVNDALTQLGNTVSIYVDSGITKFKEASTIIDLTNPASPVIVREGVISGKEILSLLK